MATLSIAGLEGLLKDLGADVPIPLSPEAAVLSHVFDIYRCYLADTASKKIECDFSLAYEAVQSANNKDNGDLALVLPKLKIKGIKPKDLAAECIGKFSSTPLVLLPLPDAVHLRFFFNPKSLSKLLLPYINDRGSDYGRNISHGAPGAEGTGDGRQKVVIEFSSPNLASEFNGYHLRSTVLGAQIAKLHELMGFDVVRLNYLGDWGKQLGLLAVGWGRFGSEEAFQKSPMEHLLEVFEKIDEEFKPEVEASRKAKEEKLDTAAIESQGIYAERDNFFKRMEDKEPEALDLWKRFRDVSIDYYTKAYARLGVTFDEYSGESQVTPESIEKVESLLKEKGIYEESEGSWIIDFDKHGTKKLGTAVVRFRTGSTTYLLRDIASALDRENAYSFDKMIYIVSAEQDLHFQRVFQALELIGREDLAAKLQHVGFGKVSDISPQLGKVNLLGDILDQCVGAMRDTLGPDQDDHPPFENSEASAAALGVSTIIGQDAHSRRLTAYHFNSKKMMSFDGETGPSIQASYAKLQHAIKELGVDSANLSSLDYTFLQEEPWVDVLRTLVQYPDVVLAAYKGLEPSLVQAYLFRLIEELMNCLEDDDEDEDEAGPSDAAEAAPAEPEPESPEELQAQLAVYQAAKQVLDNGLALLGITPIA